MHGSVEPFALKYPSASCNPELRVLATTILGSLPKFNFRRSPLGLKEGILLALDTEFPFKTRLSKVF